MVSRVELAREKALEMHSLMQEKYGADKPIIWVCGLKGMPGAKESVCKKCKVKIFYDDKMVHLVAIKHKKLCILCALKDEELPPEQKAILESIFEK